MVDIKWEAAVATLQKASPSDLEAVSEDNDLKTKINRLQVMQS